MPRYSLPNSSMDKLDQTRFRAALRLSDGFPISNLDFVRLEETRGISVPGDLRDFLLAHGSGIPSPNVVTVSEVLRPSLSEIFHPSEGASRLAWHPDLPQLLVFGSDHFGGHFCISVGAAKGAIFWVDHEETNPDCLSVRIVSRFQFLPPDLARGVTKLADSLSEFLQMLHHSTDDYIVHLLRHDDAGFRDFIRAHGVAVCGVTGAPLLEIVAEHGSLDQVTFAFGEGARSASVIPKAIRNLREPESILRFLLEQGEDPNANDGYAMKYARKHRLSELEAILVEAGMMAQDFASAKTTEVIGTNHRKSKGPCR